MAGGTPPALPDIHARLIKLANDVESNPGPPALPETRLAQLEKVVSDLQKEVKLMRLKVVEQSTRLEEQAAKLKDKSKCHTDLMRLGQQVSLLQETDCVQMSGWKQMKADMRTLHFDLASIRNLLSQQRSDLNQMSDLALSDLKTIKDEYSSNLRLFRLSQSEGQSQQQHFSTMSQELKLFCGSQSQSADAIRRGILALKDSNRAQMISLKNCFDAVLANVAHLSEAHVQLRTDTRSELDGSEARLMEAMSAGSEVTASALASLGDKVHSLGREVELRQEAVEQLQLQLRAQAEKMDRLAGQLFTQMDNRLELHSAELESVSFNCNTTKQLLDGLLERLDERLSGQAEMLMERLGQAERRTELQMDLVREQLDHVQTEHVRQNEWLERSLSESLHKDLDGVERLVKSVCDRMDQLDAMYDDIQDRVFEIDKNRKNNLVFYGVKGDDSDPDECEKCIKALFRTHLQVTREIPLTKVVRIWNGPSFRGLKPILVCFQLFKDKEHVLRKSGLLRGTNIYLTEDFSRKIRQHREQLWRYARDVRQRCPEVRCRLHYDRLYVDNDVFLFNEVQQCVQPVLMRMPDPVPRSVPVADGRSSEDGRASRSSARAAMRPPRLSLPGDGHEPHATAGRVRSWSVESSWPRLPQIE